MGVEVGTKRAFVFAERYSGPGGLPVGTAGRALLLLSGGIDSPVAGILAAKRGLRVDGIHFESPPFTGPKALEKVCNLGRLMRRYDALDNLFVVKFTETQKQLRDAGPGELAVVLYRRMMLRISAALAKKQRSEALITGDSVAQVASQTLRNMATIEEACDMMVLRPLVMFDKSETTTLAERYGTFETSIQPFEDCCALFVPAHPATGARLDVIKKVEARLDLNAMLEEALEGTRQVVLD